ncbi:hypothetical protein Mic7113_0411 [Allocoleopsis franciscana PCC 7113]|uniref:Uncharacterized protein n=2 Tax=Allocoleopsis TaxID=2886347 RepID=K9W946_9CYAN|nr:hypothetical protein Mic7113_0411 [Allocoleopsis franciscana PCC 7113]
MKRLIEAMIITIVLAIAADPALVTMGVTFFQVSSQPIGINSKNIALEPVQIPNEQLDQVPF